MSMMQRMQSDPRPSVAAQWALADSQTRREILQCCARFSPDDFRAEAQAIDTIVMVVVERQDGSRGRRRVSTRVQERELTEFFGVHLSGINPMGTRTLASQGIHATLYLEEEEVDAQDVNGQAPPPKRQRRDLPELAPEPAPQADVPWTPALELPAVLAWLHRAEAAAAAGPPTTGQQHDNPEPAPEATATWAPGDPTSYIQARQDPDFGAVTFDQMSARHRARWAAAGRGHLSDRRLLGHWVSLSFASPSQATNE